MNRISLRREPAADSSCRAAREDIPDSVHPCARPDRRARPDACPVGCQHRVRRTPRQEDLPAQRGYSLIDLLMVVALIGVVAGIAVPGTGAALATHRFRGDAQALTQMVALAKMRASAGFTRVRVRADLRANTYVLEIWNKTTSAWVAEGGVMRTSPGVAFGFATLATPPPNTQQAIAQSPVCRTGLAANTAAIGDSACIIFNSRGLPVDGGGALFGGHALYLTDGAQVAATTITATPRIRRWQSAAQTATWREQQ